MSSDEDPTTDSPDAEAVKADLQQYLRLGREALLWKLDGLDEYDARRPMTPTGTNLLGLVKHLAAVEAGYFGATFDRPLPEAPAWMSDYTADPHQDMFATAQESRQDVTDFYRRATAHADDTIARTSLWATGTVPWWPPATATVPLHRILVHVATETHRHAGHADLARELIDGAAGLRPDNDNLGLDDPTGWPAHRARVEQAAREAAGR